MSKVNKYKNCAVVIDDIPFDSIVEGNYYLKLKEDKAAGKIRSFELQPVFILQDKFEKDGNKYQPIKLKADFRVIYPDGRAEVVDVKGMPTPVAIMKRKMFDFVHPLIPLIWIAFSKMDGGWIEYDDLKKKRKIRSEIKVGLRCDCCQDKKPKGEIKIHKDMLKKIKKETGKLPKINWTCLKCCAK